MELFIIRVKFAIYYFLHFNSVRKVVARLRAKSAIYDWLVNFRLSLLLSTARGTRRPRTGEALESAGPAVAVPDKETG